MKTILFVIVFLFGCSSKYIKESVKEPTLQQKVQIMRDDYSRAFIQFAKQHREEDVDYTLRYIDSTGIMFLTLYSVADAKTFVLMDKGDIHMYVFLLSWEMKYSKDKYHWSWIEMAQTFLTHDFNEIESFEK